jgi:hypothetical protein
MTVNRESLEKLGRFLLRGLRIGASTVSIVELLRNDWTGGCRLSARSLRIEPEGSGPLMRSHDEGCQAHRPPPWHRPIVWIRRWVHQRPSHNSLHPKSASFLPSVLAAAARADRCASGGVA